MVTEELYRHIIDNLNDGVCVVNSDQTITFWNKAAEEITGYAERDAINSASGLLCLLDIEGNPLHTKVDGTPRRIEALLKHKHGHRVPVLINSIPLQENGKPIGAIGIFAPSAPIVCKDALVEQLSSMAMHDALTGLPNRRYLQSFLEYRLSEYNRFRSTFALLFMDIDDFREINNAYGHDAGDTVLHTFAKSISKATRKSDMFGRWGGEEFVGIYTIKESTDAPIIAEKIRKLVAHMEIPHKPPLSVTTSVGITVVRPTDTAKDILERADAFMYKSKASGKNRITADAVPPTL